MSEIRYLLDENTDPLFRAELLKREPRLVVWRVDDPGAPASGTAERLVVEGAYRSSDRPLGIQPYTRIWPLPDAFLQSHDDKQKTAT